MTARAEEVLHSFDQLGDDDKREVVSALLRQNVLAESPKLTGNTDNIVERTYGILGWTGDPAILRKIAEDVEFGVEESP